VANYQKLRRRGITPGTVDMIIGTYCIETGAQLLTADLDFAPMRDHLGLRLAPTR
jgi:predicted nucleic acid-binding protein